MGHYCMDFFLVIRWIFVGRMTLRIIDIEQTGSTAVVDMHIFGPNADKEISTDMTLCVWKEHMRSQIPSAETRRIPGWHGSIVFTVCTHTNGLSGIRSWRRMTHHRPHMC